MTALLYLMAFGWILGAMADAADRRPEQIRTLGLELARRLAAVGMLRVLDILTDYSLHADVDIQALFVPVLMIHEGLSIIRDYTRFRAPGAELLDRVAEALTAALTARLRTPEPERPKKI